MSSKKMDLETNRKNTAIDKTTQDKDDSRRSLLKKLAVGGLAGAAMPSQWSRPVIDSVVLPAHAQTSDITIRAGGGGGSAPGPVPADSITDKIMEILVPSSAATPICGKNETPSQGYCIEITVAQSGGVPTGIAVNKACFKEFGGGCAGKFRLRNLEGSVALVTDVNDPSKWVGSVLGFYLELSDINTSGAVVATSVYGGHRGTLLNNTSCSCFERNPCKKEMCVDT